MGKKDKGSKAELEVARLLQEWWRRLDPGAVFVRTPRSGGWLAGRDHFDARGDVMSKTATRFPWCVEVKRREAWSIKNVAAARPCPVWRWWAKACEDARLAGLEPMLWTRHNRREWVVLVPAAQRARMPRPMLAWPRGAVERVAPGADHPLLYGAPELLGTDPRAWVTA